MLIDKVNEKTRELRENLGNYHKDSFDERINNLSDEQKEKYKQSNKSSSVLFMIFGVMALVFTVGLICLAIFDDEMTTFGIGGAVFFFVCAVFFFVYAIMLSKRSNQQIYIAYLKAEDKKHFDESNRNFPQEAAELVVGEYFRSQNFSYTQKIHIVAVKGQWQYIYINSETQKLKYLNLENDCDVTVDFDNIVSYEIYEDGKEIVDGNAAGVFLGGALFGLAGALVAQNLPQEVEKTVTTLKLVIRLNSFNQPQLVIDFIDNNLNRYSSNYKETLRDIYENLRLIYSNLEIIKHNTAPSSQPKELATQQPDELKEELVKLKGLYDSGLITQEEFEAKKKQLLGL